MKSLMLLAVSDKDSYISPEDLEYMRMAKDLCLCACYGFYKKYKSRIINYKDMKSAINMNRVNTLLFGNRTQLMRQTKGALLGFKFPEEILLFHLVINYKCKSCNVSILFATKYADLTNTIITLMKFYDACTIQYYMRTMAKQYMSPKWALKLYSSSNKLCYNNQYWLIREAKQFDIFAAVVDPSYIYEIPKSDVDICVNYMTCDLEPNDFYGEFNKYYEYFLKHISAKNTIIFIMCYVIKNVIIHELIKSSYVTYNTLCKLIPYGLTEIENLLISGEVECRNLGSIKTSGIYLQVSITLLRANKVNILNSSYYDNTYTSSGNGEFAREVTKWFMRNHPNKVHTIQFISSAIDLAIYDGIKIRLVISPIIFKIIGGNQYVNYINCLSNDHVFFDMIERGDVEFANFIPVEHKRYIEAVCKSPQHDELYEYICNSQYYENRQIKSANNI